MLPVEQYVHFVQLALRKLRRYTEYTPGIDIAVPDEAIMTVLRDKQTHTRVRAMLIDISMY